MHPLARWLILAPSALLLVACPCGYDYAEAEAKHKAQTDLGCDSVNLHRKLSDGKYEVSGCGKTGTYSCVGDGRDGKSPVCTLTAPPVSSKP